MKYKYYTIKELFNIVDNSLKEKNLIPDIINYGLPGNRDVQIRETAWDVYGIVNFGSNEGIYLDIYLEGEVTKKAKNWDEIEKVWLACYKTLGTSKEDFKKMSDLNTEFVFDLRKYINDNWGEVMLRTYGIDINGGNK